MTRFFCHKLILGLIIPTLLLASACGDDDEASGSNGEVRVLTTLPLFADFVREVGGDRADVDPLLPGGADPHTWEPAPRDVAQLEQADIVFANGLGLEPAALELIKTNLPSGVPLVELGYEAEEAGAALRESEEHLEGGDQADQDGDATNSQEDAHQHAEGDPHLWMDVNNASLYAEIIRNELIAVDPDGEATYSANYEDYATELAELSQYMQDTVSSIPDDDRKLITTHDAFGYLADYLGFVITAVVSGSPGQDPSPGDIEAIVTAVEEEGVPAVFVEPQVSGESGILEQIAEDTGAQVCTLYSDAFDDEVDSYIEMMRFDADELARCLGGDE